jgi:hypothetical protein
MVKTAVYQLQNLELENIHVKHILCLLTKQVKTFNSYTDIYRYITQTKNL